MDSLPLNIANSSSPNESVSPALLEKATGSKSPNEPFPKEAVASGIDHRGISDSTSSEDPSQIDISESKHDAPSPDAALCDRTELVEEINGLDMQNAIAGLGYGGTLDFGHDQPQFDDSSDNGLANDYSDRESDGRGHLNANEDADLHTSAVHAGQAASAPDSNDTSILPLNNINQPAAGTIAAAADNDDRPVEDDIFSDLGYDDSSATSYCSTLRSEAHDYYWEHGRRYHSFGGGRYLLPNDDQELNREDMKHHMWRLVLEGALHLSPIGEHPQKILDIGTGSGIWAMQTADAYPSAEVIGFDISPVQPAWVPPNLHFEVDDLEQEWLWRTDAFDLVHCRFMFMSVRDWPGMLRQAYRVLKPGAYIELAELDLHPGPAYEGMPIPPVISKWFRVQGEMLQRQGFDMRIASKFKALLEDAGFESVVEEVRNVPWGRWPKDERMKMIGYWHLGKY